MKTLIRMVVIIIMAISTIMNFTSCIRELQKNNAKEIASLLQTKYGEEFVVDMIGNRLSSDRADTVTAFCHPKHDSRIVFEAVMGHERVLLSDDYLKRIIETEAKEYIESVFITTGIKASVNVSISRIEKTIDIKNMDLKQLISTCPNLSLTFTTIVRDGTDPKTMYNSVVDILNYFYSGDSEMLLGTTIWKYDEYDYEQCFLELNHQPYTSKTILEKYNPLSSVIIAIVDGLINIDVVDFSNSF